MARGARPRQQRIEVWLSPEELSQIDTNAKACGMSRSQFLRELGRGHQPQSVFDHQAIRELIKTRADQGRLGGLLKLWLSERKGEGTRPRNVRQVLQQIESLQQQLAQIVMRGIKIP